MYAERDPPFNAFDSLGRAEAIETWERVGAPGGNALFDSLGRAEAIETCLAGGRLPARHRL